MPDPLHAMATPPSFPSPHGALHHRTALQRQRHLRRRGAAGDVARHGFWQLSGKRYPAHLAAVASAVKQAGCSDDWQRWRVQRFDVGVWCRYMSTAVTRLQGVGRLFAVWSIAVIDYPPRDG
jgi:hypothetical protein